MKRTNTSLRCASSVALAMTRRTVWRSSEGSSDAFAITRVLPASAMSTPKGAPAQPTSIWPLITWVSVAGAAPVAVGLNFTPDERCSASTAVWLDDPLVEYATVLPSVSLRRRVGEIGGTHQKICAP